MTKKNRPNLVTGLVSNSASIIEAAQQVEKDVTGKKTPGKIDLQENESEEIENRTIEIIEDEKEELSSESVIDSSFDISLFFQEMHSKDMAFKTGLMCTKHISLIRNLSTVFEVPMQAITYNIIDHWYKTYKPWIDKERKKRTREIF